MLDWTNLKRPGQLRAIRRLEILDRDRHLTYGAFADAAAAMLDAPMARICLLDEDDVWVSCASAPYSDVAGRDLTLCRATHACGAPFKVSDVAEDPQFANTLAELGGEARSYLGVPIRLSDGYSPGVLSVADNKVRAFGERDVKMMEHLARCVAQEIELRLRACVDPTTGLQNRAQFMNDMVRLMDKRSLEPSLVLMILDIDHFKKVNDTYGHEAGDLALAAVAGCLSETVGSTVRVSRIGGEEFAIVLDGADSAEVEATVRRILSAVGEVRLATLPDLRLTISAGVAALTAEIPNLSAWMKIADAALYAAKIGGRNRAHFIKDGAHEVIVVGSDAQTETRLAKQGHLLGAAAQLAAPLTLLVQPLISLPFLF